MFEDILQEKKEFTREEKTLIFVLKTLNDLVDKGFCEGGGYEITEKGLEILGDFVPTEQEMKDCIENLKNSGDVA